MENEVCEEHNSQEEMQHVAWVFDTLNKCMLIKTQFMPQTIHGMLSITFQSIGRHRQPASPKV
jgi:hypothetical protein